MIVQAAGFHSSGDLRVVQLATGNRDLLQYSASSQAINDRLPDVRELNDPEGRALELLERLRAEFGLEPVLQQRHPQ